MSMKKERVIFVLKSVKIWALFVETRKEGLPHHFCISPHCFKDILLLSEKNWCCCWRLNVCAVFIHFI